MFSSNGTRAHAHLSLVGHDFFKVGQVGSDRSGERFNLLLACERGGGSDCVSWPCSASSKQSVERRRQVRRVLSTRATRCSRQLTGQEDEDAPGRIFGMDLEDRLERRVEKVVLRRRRVLDRDLMLTSANVQNRGVVEKLAEPLGVDGRRHDDNLELCRFALAVGFCLVLDLLALLGIGCDLGFPPLLDVLEEPHEHVGAEAALVRLVEDDDVVRVEFAIAQHLGEQGTVGRVLEAGGATRAVVEPDRVADEAAEGDAGLGGDALGERDGGDSTRLGADHPRALA